MSRIPTTLSETEAERRRREEELLLLLALFLWDAERLVYVTRTGRIVPQRLVRAAVDAVVEATRVDVAALSRQVSAAEMDVGEWQEGVARRLKTMHTATAAAASGGFRNMAPPAIERLEQTLKFHFVKLQGFAEDVARGFTTVQSVQMDTETGELQPVTRIVRMTENKIISRAEMYAAAGVSVSYEGGRRDGAKDAGWQFEKNILHPADHCQPDPKKEGVSCVEETLKGWQPIGTLSAVGDRFCLTNCKCSFSFAHEIPESVPA